jgi:hypothetical protein
MAEIPPQTKNEIIKALRPEDQPAMKKSLDFMDEMLKGSGMENLHPALKPWVQMETAMGPFVKHPLCYMALGGEAGLMVVNANNFYAAKIQARRNYLDAKNWAGYIVCFERPWRMAKLEVLWKRKKISKREMRELLAHFWIDMEMPQSNQAEPMHLFREAGFTTDNRRAWKALSDNFTLYRGVDGEFELTRDGPSWTLDFDTAKFFATRYGAEGTVWKYEAMKSEALAYFKGRNEAEIILDFQDASDPFEIVPYKIYGLGPVG